MLDDDYESMIIDYFVLYFFLVFVVRFYEHKSFFVANYT